MLSMSKALGSAQAKEYYSAEYTDAGENYYTEGEKVAGVWAGRLAEEEWGLSGDITEEALERLCDGQNPLTGEQLVRHVMSIEYTNEFGEEVKSSEHRAGLDATFSAPKSVSLAALVGGDERVREAHRKSVDAALSALEEFTQSRMGGNRAAINTGKFIAAKFEHDSARPDRETGYAAPQLHTHTVIFNLTKTEDGKIRAMQPLELYRSQAYATAHYRSTLAIELQKLGYEVEVDHRTGAPEIKGFSREYLEESSPRSAEIKREARGIKERLEREGATVKEGAGLMQAAAKIDRASKDYDRAEMKRRHLEMEERFGHQAKQVVERAILRGAIIRTDEDIARRARESVTFARENAVEREAVADRRDVIKDALRRNLGFTTTEAVMKELEQREAAGEFVGIVRERGVATTKETTTEKTLRMEEHNLRTVSEGRDTQTPLADGEKSEAKELISVYEKKGLTLGDGQRKAIEEILTTTDRITGLQGGAGTGKTTALEVIRAGAMLAGYEVEGLAPTTRSAALLAEAGMPTKTLQKFLARSDRQESSEELDRKVFYVVDETSLASTRNIYQFLKKINPQDRVLFVGDERQHQAVEAGSPFEQLRKNGMQTARLTEIVRQKDESLRQAVEMLASKETAAAVKALAMHGRVVEIKDSDERLERIAKDFVERPEGTLVISPANKERVVINALIQGELRSAGKLSESSNTQMVLVIRQDMTGEERKFANAYEVAKGETEADIIRYNKASKVNGVGAGDYARVVGKNHAENTITVRMLEDGRELTYDPKRLSGVSVYKEKERTFAEGDRLQFRAPFKEERISNGELGTIKRIKGDRFTVTLDKDGREVSFDTKAYRHLDLGYAVTSYSSQGQTVNRVLVNANTKETKQLLNERMAYVAVSRARFDARLYTDSAENLSAALSRSVDKEIAVEALKESIQLSRGEKFQHHPSTRSQEQGDDNFVVSSSSNKMAESRQMHTTGIQTPFRSKVEMSVEGNQQQEMVRHQIATYKRSSEAVKPKEYEAKRVENNRGMSW